MVGSDDARSPGRGDAGGRTTTAAAPVPSPRPRKRRRLRAVIRTFFLLALTAVVVVQGVALVEAYQRLDAQQRRLATAEDQLATLTDRADRFAKRVNRASDNVKQLEVEANKRSDRELNVGKVVDAARGSVVTVECGRAIGSGFAVNVDLREDYQSGILTNHHVVEECVNTETDVSVRRSGDALTAKLWAWDAENDLAFIYLTEELPPLDNAAIPKVGDPVVAIGSPYGLEGTVTTGVISQVHDEWYQTDAAMNPGNSGGPLLDRHGAVLGVNTFKAFGGEGLNFATRMRVACEEIFSGSSCEGSP